MGHIVGAFFFVVGLKLASCTLHHHTSSPSRTPTPLVHHSCWPTEDPTISFVSLSDDKITVIELPGEETLQPTPSTYREDTHEPTPSTMREDTHQPTPSLHLETNQPTPTTRLEDTLQPTPSTRREDTLQPTPQNFVEDIVGPTFAPTAAPGFWTYTDTIIVCSIALIAFAICMLITICYLSGYFGAKNNSSGAGPTERTGLARAEAGTGADYGGTSARSPPPVETSPPRDNERSKSKNKSRRGGVEDDRASMTGSASSRASSRAPAYDPFTDAASQSSRDGVTPV